MESLIFRGGWIMGFIFLGSVSALALVLERLWFFWSIRLDVYTFARQVFYLVAKGNLEDAIRSCDESRHPLAMVFRAGLQHAGEEPLEIERVMEREGVRQVQRVERNLNYLVMIVGISPLMGFLGTILGLIHAFMAWEKFAESVTVSQLAAGIYQAMITTAAGLAVAIPYFVIYHVFLNRANQVTQDLNHYGDELLSVLSKMKRRGR